MSRPPLRSASATIATARTTSSRTFSTASTATRSCLFITATASAIDSSSSRIESGLRSSVSRWERSFIAEQDNQSWHGRPAHAQAAIAANTWAGRLCHVKSRTRRDRAENDGPPRPRHRRHVRRLGIQRRRREQREGERLLCVRGHTELLRCENVDELSLVVRDVSKARHDSPVARPAPTGYELVNARQSIQLLPHRACDEIGSGGEQVVQLTRMVTMLELVRHDGLVDDGFMRRVEERNHRWTVSALGR